MKAQDLKTKSEDELKKMLLDLRKDQFNARFQKSGGTLENTASIRKTRRTIARVKTFLTAMSKGQPIAAKKPAAAKPAAKAAAPKAAAPKAAPKAKETAAKKPAAKKTTAAKKPAAKKEA